MDIVRIIAKEANKYVLVGPFTVYDRMQKYTGGLNPRGEEFR